MLFSLIVMLGKFLQAWNTIILDTCPIILDSCLVEASPGFFFLDISRCFVRFRSGPWQSFSPSNTIVFLAVCFRLVLCDSSCLFNRGPSSQMTQFGWAAKFRMTVPGLRMMEVIVLLDIIVSFPRSVLWDNPI